jgi:hypothetical protein
MGLEVEVEVEVMVGGVHGGPEDYPFPVRGSRRCSTHSNSGGERRAMASGSRVAGPAAIYHAKTQYSGATRPVRFPYIYRSRLAPQIRSAHALKSRASTRYLSNSGVMEQLAYDKRVRGRKFLF